MRMHAPLFVIIISLFLSTTLISQAQPSPAPRVWSFTANQPSSNTNTATFTVRFSEAVTGVDSTDFSTSGDDRNATITRVEPTETRDKYTIHVTLDGPSTQLQLTLIDDDTILNSADVPLGGIGMQNGNAISVGVKPSLTNPIARNDISVPQSISYRVGEYSSIAMTSNNIPVIGYYDQTNLDLKLAMCDDIVCAYPTISTIDSFGYVGYFISVALTSADIPVISYYDTLRQDLKIAVCNNMQCTSPTLTTLDTGYVGLHTSIAITSANIPIISYYDFTNKNLKLAICNNTACSTSTNVVVDSDGDVGEYTSLALTSSDIPVISYLKSMSYAYSELKLAICNSTLCDDPTIQDIDTTGGLSEFTSLALTSDNLPIISYGKENSYPNYDIKLVMCTDTPCSTSNDMVIDTIPMAQFASLKLTSDNTPVLSYVSSDDIKLAVCSDNTCSNKVTSTMNESGTVASYISLALTSDNLPVVSYFNSRGTLNLGIGTIVVDQGQPNSFTKSFPSNNSTNQTTAVTLSWMPSSGTTSYEYCIATSASTCSTWTSTGTSTSVNVTGLTAETTYYWQVRAANTVGTTLANTGDPWRFTVHTPRVADDGIYVGSYLDVQLTSNNLPVVSFYDTSNDQLKLAMCDTVECLNPIIRIIATSGSSTSLVLTATDIPIISYHDGAQGNLHMAVCNDTDCDAPTIVVVDDNPNNVGWRSSIALTSTGKPVISYADLTDYDLLLALCDTLTCANPTIQTVDSTGSVGSDAALALTSTDIPVISYFDATNTNLKLAICDDTDCDNPTLSIIDSEGMVGIYTSLAITSDDIPVISYNDYTIGELTLAVCDDITCANPAIQSLESGVISSGWHNSIALTSDNLPIISYFDDASADHSLIYCHTRTCDSHNTQLLDSIGIVGEYTNLALTNDDAPVIAYVDGTNGNLKLDVAPNTIYSGEPVDFVTTAPSNNSTATTSSVTLRWATTAGASSYEYCVSQSATSCTSWTTTGTTTNATVTGLAHNTTYFWQVRARNNAGTTLANRGTPWRLTIVLPPVAFNKSAPANNARNQRTTVILSWAASTRATSYEYCIALTTASCTNWKSTGTARTATVSGLAKNKTYFWQVRAKNTVGTILATGSHWRFTTAR